nr:MAG TPA: hypothetical protein [Caudoviricetes sp.]DAX20277.1 MAG TPA: hypothetical protein [Caudoviricetes sp.]
MTKRWKPCGENPVRQCVQIIALYSQPVMRLN